jgi:hypothetical protein
MPNGVYPTALTLIHVILLYMWLLKTVVYRIHLNLGYQNPLTTLTRDESMLSYVPLPCDPVRCLQSAQALDWALWILVLNKSTGNKVCSMKRKTVTVNAKWTQVMMLMKKVFGTLTGMLKYVFQGLALENKLCSYLQRIGSHNSVPVYSEQCNFKFKFIAHICLQSTVNCFVKLLLCAEKGNVYKCYLLHVTPQLVYHSLWRKDAFVSNV